MLSMAGWVGKVEGYTVFGDDASPTTFWILPDKSPPALVRDEDGKAQFSLIVYRRDETRIDPDKPEDDVGGGILTFSAELPLPQADFDAVRGALRSRIPPDAADAQITLNLVPFTKGNVRVAIAGERAGETGVVTDGEFVRTVLGEGGMSGLGGTRKAFTAKLRQDGAALLEKAVALDTLPLFLEYELHFEHRLEAVKLTVWCQLDSEVTLKKELEAHQESYQEDGYFDDDTKWRDVNHASTVVQTCTRSKQMGVEVLPATSEVDEDTLATLEKFGMDLLTAEIGKCIEATPLPPERQFDGFLKEFSNTCNNTLNFTLSRKMVLERPFTSAGALPGFDPAELKRVVAFVDLRTAFFALLRVPVRVNVDFERMPIDSVTVHVTYRRRAIGGTGIEVSTESFAFTAAGEVHTFDAYANTLGEVSWDWNAEVFYKNSQETARLSRSGVKGRQLTVNVGDLGVLYVDLGMGLVDPKDYPQAHVMLRYDSEALGRRLESSFKLTDDNPTATWVQVVHEVPQRGYEYRVDWRTKDGQILQGAWVRSTASKLLLDGPRRDKLGVSVSATGDFKQLAAVAVALHYEDPAHSYTRDGNLSFTAEGQAQVWDVDLQDPSRREYSYRYTLAYKSGLVRELPEDGSWLPGRPGFLIVGERYDLEVEILPFLLIFHDRCKLAQVNIRCPQATTESARAESFVFQSATDAPVKWRVDLQEGAAAEYEAEVIYTAADGSETRLLLGTLKDKKLVLKPLPPAPPAPPTPPGG